MRAYLDRQRAFTERFLRDRGVELSTLRENPAELVRWVKEYAFHLEGEVHELVGEFPGWKMHAPATGLPPEVRSNAREEWVDVLKYLLGMAVLLGFTEAELRTAFDAKSEVVELKYDQERRLDTLSPAAAVVGVDVDGVLVDHVAAFRDWLLSDGGFDLPAHVRLNAARSRSTGQLRTALEGAGAYEHFKHLYRESGAKAGLPAREGARLLLRGLRGAGASVVVLSARPVTRYARLFSDTLRWLELRGLDYAAVYFDPEKHLKILRRFPHLRFMVEDTPAVARAVAEAGVKVLLPTTPDNADADLPPGVERFPDLLVLRDRALELLETP